VTKPAPRASLFAQLAAGLALLSAPILHAASDTAVELAEPAEADTATADDTSFFSLGRRDPEAYSITSVARGLSAHRPNYILPLTYSPDLAGDKFEVVFQISAKQRLFARNLFFAYTQKSLWQFYSPDQSAPFRDTIYNPEVFYRWLPDSDAFRYWGADFGLEHESNGQPLPRSRSWNRLYVAPFQARGRQLAYLKLWYRIPEERKDAADDARGDDNPDIHRFYGYGEFRYQRQFGDEGRLAALMLRGNPATGKGAIELMLSQPNSRRSLFYCLSLWHGYGESLIDYNRSLTRLGVGIMLSR
jgi:phospholipase A1/A2